MITYLKMRGQFAPKKGGQFGPKKWGLFHRNFHVNPSIGFLVGDAGIIFKTTDGGSNWFLQISPTNELLYSVDFADSINGIIVGDDATILRTNDGGQSWLQIPSPYLFGDSLQNYELRTVQFISDSIAFAAGGPFAGSSGILIKTLDSGNSWQTVFESFNFPVFLQIEFINDTLGFAAGSCHVNNPNCYRSKINKTIDGGISWTEIYFDWADELRSIDVINNSIYSVGFYNGGTNPVIVYSSDNGQNWIYQNALNLSFPYQVFFTDTSTGYIVGDSGKVLKTTNGGVGFSELISDVIQFNIFPNPNDGQFSLRYDNTIFKKLTIEVFDLIGNKVLLQNVQNAQEYPYIDVSYLNSGVFLLRISHESWSETLKVIIQK